MKFDSESNDCWYNVDNVDNLLKKRNKPSIWEWFMPPIYGENWGWFITYDGKLLWHQHKDPDLTEVKLTGSSSNKQLLLSMRISNDVVINPLFLGTWEYTWFGYIWIPFFHFFHCCFLIDCSTCSSFIILSFPVHLHIHKTSSCEKTAVFPPGFTSTWGRHLAGLVFDWTNFYPLGASWSMPSWDAGWMLDKSRWLIKLVRGFYCSVCVCVYIYIHI